MALLDSYTEITLTTLLTPDRGFTHTQFHNTTSWMSSYLEMPSDPQVKGSVPPNCSPTSDANPNSRPPIYPQLLFSMATNRKFPWPPPSWIWLCGRIARRTEGNISSYLPVCYKIWSWLRMNSQGLRGKVSSAGASVAVELGCIILHEQGCVHQPESSLNAMLLEFWWRLHHVGMVNYYLHF